MKLPKEYEELSNWHFDEKLFEDAIKHSVPLLDERTERLLRSLAKDALNLHTSWK